MNGLTATVDVRIDARLFWAFALFDAFRVKKCWKGPALFATILLVFALLCFSMRGSADQAALLGGVLLLVGLGLPAVYFLYFFATVRAQVRELGLKKPQPVYTVKLTEEADGIRVTNPKGETARYRWEDIFGVYHRRTCIYLYVHSDRAFLLPLKDVEDQSETLETLLERH